MDWVNVIITIIATFASVCAARFAYKSSISWKEEKKTFYGLLIKEGFIELDIFFDNLPEMIFGDLIKYEEQIKESDKIVKNIEINMHLMNDFSDLDGKFVDSLKKLFSGYNGYKLGNKKRQDLHDELVSLMKIKIANYTSCDTSDSFKSKINQFFSFD